MRSGCSKHLRAPLRALVSLLHDFCLCLPAGSISGSCTDDRNCRFGLHASGTTVRAASRRLSPATSDASPARPVPYPSLAPPTHRHTGLRPALASHGSDTFPTHTICAQASTLYANPWPGYSIWFHGSNQGETLCGDKNSRDGPSNNFWSDGDIGKVEIDGSDIKMYVDGTLVRTCTGVPSTTWHAHAFVFQLDAVFTVDGISR